MKIFEQLETELKRITPNGIKATISFELNLGDKVRVWYNSVAYGDIEFKGNNLIECSSKMLKKLKTLKLKGGNKKEQWKQTKTNLRKRKKRKKK